MISGTLTIDMEVNRFIERSVEMKNLKWLPSRRDVTELLFCY